MELTSSDYDEAKCVKDQKEEDILAS